MKFLNNYIETKQEKLLEEKGAFFAFSKEQFNEQKKEGVEYIFLGSGLFCPEENGVELIKEHDEILKKGIAQDIAENGKEAIIERELLNHECYWTASVQNAIEALKIYNFSESEILKVYGKTKHKYDY